jgi:hypothetical protein
MSSSNKNNAANAANDSTLNGKEFEMMINNRKQDISKETIRETKNEKQTKLENDFINSILAGDVDDGDNDIDRGEIKNNKNNKNIKNNNSDGAESDIDINQLVENLQKTIKHTNTNEDLNITKLKQHI